MGVVEYRADRHLGLDEAARFSNLSSDNLTDRFFNDNLPVYGKDGTRFVDRLDLGRVMGNGYSGQEKKMLTMSRYFTDGTKHPFESISYKEVYAQIKSPKGKLIFEQRVTVPDFWSELAAKVVANKYFHKPNKEEWKSKIEGGQEHDARQLVNRVSKFFAGWGQRLGYFSDTDAKVFEEELAALQINQKFAFNSPVYFNAGLFDVYGISGSPGINYARELNTGLVVKIEDGSYVRPQCHACFIKGPDDNLESILKHCEIEGGIFASGSGVGQDIGALRANGEPLSSGGQSSGAMSFFKLYDTVASLVKSGGKTRRAARMTTLRQSHPDVMEFIFSKVREDKKALILMENGYAGGMEGEAFTTVAYQNTNISVRLDDHFFEQLKRNGNIDLIEIKTGKVRRSVSADDMLKAISFGAWRVGDPGVQYESIIQKMHTCKNSGRINSSNPCSEYMFLDNTSCNLGSLNLLKFADGKGNFDVESFRKAVRIAQIALDIANDAASYPDSEIARISPEFRTTGLGYANLGSLLMRKGLAYDSDAGRAFAAAVTAIMHGEANKTSIELSEALGPFTHFELNKEPMLEVMGIHKNSLDDIMWNLVADEKLKQEAYNVWTEVVDRGEKNGFRNAQVTVIAPTGTIAFMMDCDTTGIEPPIGLVSTKTLAGGGSLQQRIEEVPNALVNLGYDQRKVQDIISFIEKNGCVDGAPYLSPDHYAVFDTAFASKSNGRAISFDGHLKMLGAVQPFVSGAISKTCNVPERASVKEIYDGFVLGHELGLKALAIFRDNSKPNSVLSVGGRTNGFRKLKRGEREELPANATAYKQRVKIGGTTFHVIIPEFPDGRPGEVFISAYSAGSTMKALVEGIGLDFSREIQYGIPLEELVRKNLGMEFEPRGVVTEYPHIQRAHSIRDFIARFLGLEYLGRLDLANVPVDKSRLRGAQNGAFETFEMMNVDLWDFANVINHTRFGGFGGNNTDKEGQSNNHGVAMVRESQSKTDRACPGCGHMLTQISPNCYKCGSCGESAGLGCGA